MIVKIFNKTYLEIVVIVFSIGIPISFGMGLLFRLIPYHIMPFWMEFLVATLIVIIFTYLPFTSGTAWWLIYDDRDERIIFKRIIKIAADFRIDDIDKAIMFYTAPSKVFRGKYDGGVNIILKNGKKLDLGVFDLKIMEFLTDKFKEKKVNFLILHIVSIKEGKILLVNPYNTEEKIEISGNVFELSSAENIEYLQNYMKKYSQYEQGLNMPKA